MPESKIDSAVSAGSVKKLIFKPSGKIIWIAVGRDNEHWVDPDLAYCTCKDFYFKALSGGPDCYHLMSVREAIRTGRHVTMTFDDSEYTQFLKAILDDQASLLTRN